MKNILHILFLGFFLSACSTNNAQSLNVDQFENALKIKLNVQLLDVRTPEEYQSGHLNNAMQANWMDRPEFDRRVQALNKEEPVLIYCLSGGRSAAAAKALREKGFKEVIEMEGGINAWKQHDKPLVSVEKIKQISPESYQAMLQSSEVVLVDFGAPWCPPCRKMEPIILEMEKNFASQISIIKIDGGSQDRLMKENKIKEMPTFILYKNGQEVWRKSGILEKQKLQKDLEAAL